MEASDDFFLKISGSAVNKPKNQEEMEEFVGEAIEACQDVEPPFLGALAAITSAWSQAKQLGLGGSVLEILPGAGGQGQLPP